MYQARHRSLSGFYRAILPSLFLILSQGCSTADKGIPVDIVSFPDFSVTLDIGPPAPVDLGSVPDTAPDIYEVDAGPPPWKPSLGPGLVYASEAMDDEASLSLAWNQSESGTEVTNLGAAYRLVFEFTSQNFLGEPWVHKAFLYIPDDLFLKQEHSLAIIEQGVLMPEEQGRELFRKSYALEASVAFDVPVMVVEGLIPDGLRYPSEAISGSSAACLDTPLTEEDFIRCGFALVQETKDLTLSPFLPAGRVFLRAALAASAMVAQVQAVRPELKLTELAPKQLIFSGEGLAGMGAKMALASHEDASAAMSVGAELVDVENLALVMSQVWSDGGTWLESGVLSDSLVTDWGREHADLYDVMRFSSELTGKRLVIGVGTNDPRFPLGATELYAKYLPAEQIMVYADNTEEGIADARYQGAWRALLDRALNGAPVPKAVVSTEEDPTGYLRVQAAIVGCQAVDSTCHEVRAYVVSYHMTLVDHDYRDAVWVEVPMTRDPLSTGGAGWYGLLDPASLPSHNAFFVQITDLVDNQLRYTSSGLSFISQPYPEPSGGSN